MRVFKIEDIQPLECHVNMYYWIYYDPYFNDNDQIEKGVLILSDQYGLLEVDGDASYEDGYIAICKPYRPESFPLEFVESLGVDDIVSKYVEWIKTN